MAFDPSTARPVFDPATARPAFDPASARPAFDPPSAVPVDEGPNVPFAIDGTAKPEGARAPNEQVGGNAVTRIARAVGEGATQGLRTDDPLGFDPATAVRLQESGFLPKPGELNLSPFRTFNDLVVRPTVAGLDLVSRAIEAPVVAGVEGLAQTAVEFGASEANAGKLKRDLYGLLLAAGVATGSYPLGMGARATTRTKAEIGKRADKLADELGAELPAYQREQLRVETQKVVDESIDAALLASAREKIGTPTASEVADNARFSFTDRVITETIDAYRPIKLTAIREAEKLGEAPDLSPYIDLRLLSGIEGAILAQQRRGTLGIGESGDIVFTGEGLNDVFAPVADNLNDAMLYFAGRRAKELSDRGTEVPFSQDEISAMLRLGERNSAIENAFSAYQDYNRRTLDFAEQAGLLSPEKKKAFIEAGQSYVPYYRAVTDADKGLAGGTSVFKRLKGGDSNLGEILENINRNTIMWIDASLKNRAKVGVYNMIERYGLDDVAERVPDVSMARLADKDMAKALKQMGLENADDMVPVFMYNRAIGPDMDLVFRNGKPEVWRIKDPLFRKSIQNVTPEGFGLGVRVLSGTADVLRRGVTLSPDFMVKNLIRDTQAAYIQSQSTGRNMFIPGYSSMRGMVRRMTQDDTYWEAMANGAGFATTFQGETALSRNIRNFYGNKGINYDTVLDSPAKVMDALENITSSFEQASRLQEFAGLRAGGMSAREAAFGAREVASDFGARGANEFVRGFTATVPFLNARMQGLAKMAEVAADQPGKVALKATTAIMLPSLALYYMNKDDPEYKALPDWVRDQHWPIKRLDGGFYLIPKGFEWGAIFGSAPERMFEAIEQEHGKAFADFMLRTVFDTFAVGPPQAVAPMIDIATNRKFSDAPVVPADLEGVKPSEQFRPWTSESIVQLSQAMARETGVQISPMQAEHLVSGYFGTLGMYALSATDLLVQEASGKVRPEARLDELPLARSFVRENPMMGTQFQTDFYDLLAESRMVAATVAKMTKEGREPNLNEKESVLFAAKDSLSKVSSLAASMNAAQRMLMLDDTVSPEEKRRRIDAIQEQRNRLFLDFARGLSENEIAKDLMKSRGLTVPPERK